MEEHSFDSLAKEIADSTITRSRALKYFGAAILGSMLGGGMLNIPVAEAKKKKKKKKKHHHKPPPPLCTPGQTGCPTACTCPGSCVRLPTVGVSVCF